MLIGNVIIFTDIPATALNFVEFELIRYKIEVFKSNISDCYNIFI